MSICNNSPLDNACRNSSLRTRLGDLQDKVFKLTLAQTEYEEYTLRVEEATKYAPYYT